MKQANVNTNSKVAATYNDELERLLFECGALERQNIIVVVFTCLVLIVQFT